ncbi:MAG TPA: SH3 domain-containing protein [Pyrinomonadaceae bacterium]|nr:SH3 domain-containing protein [Acidobacteriota bacterium]HQZ95620.1 SH3 domain-containing protein [Pyrinomonadaceae bacterium]
MKRDHVDLTIALGLLLGAGLACNGLPVFQTQQTMPPPASPTPPAAQSATPDAENAKLLEKLSELEKKIDAQQKQSKSSPPPVIRSGGTNAWVNSPGDGFLALRSDPSSNGGYRVMQIPHGASVRVLSCQGFSQNIGGHTGRWCRVSYAGNTGWAFDAWLVY